MTLRTLSALVATCILVALPARADGPKRSAHQWRPQVTSVSVFKNGLGFFTRKGGVTLNDGWCVSDAIPPAAFGTLAVYSHQEDQTVDIVGSGPGQVVAFDGKDAPDDLATRRARLEASRFLKMQLTYRQESADRTAAGQLVEVGPEYVVLQSEGSNAAVPLQAITRMQLLEQPLRIHVSSDKPQMAPETTLGMAYLRKGITWIPEYTLKLVDDQTAELTLRGTLVNEAEDLIHCDVSFVVGVPHFIHTDYLAPTAVAQVIRTIGATMGPPAVMTQIAARAAIANTVQADQFSIADRPVPPGGRDIREATGNLPQFESAGSSDYTVYTRKDLTVRTGEKAIVTLFTKKIRYGHLYRWAPPKEIEHNLVLYNDADTAWTTGPCLITSGNSALSEDLLKYVPKGGKGELPVTTAVNIATNRSETEVERKLSAHQLSPGMNADLVTLEGSLLLRNYGKADAEISVESKVEGKPLSASDDAQIVLDTTNLKLLERSATIRWRVTVKPGETKTLSYRCERYVLSR